MSLNDRLKYVEMKTRHQTKFLPWYKKLWGKILLVFLLFLFVFITLSAIYIIKEVKRIRTGGGEINTEELRQTFIDLINGPGGYSLGATNPKITIVEFTDFACPYCRQSALEIIPLIKEYPDTIKLVIRDFPIHENSIDLAIAMRCAGEQNRYWEAYELTFTQQELLQDTGELLKVNLLAWAEVLGLDLIQFETCFDERRYVSSVRRDYEDGLLLEIQGTPTWYINNYPLTGHYSADKFRDLFNGLLEEAK